MSYDSVKDHLGPKDHLNDSSFLLVNYSDERNKEYLQRDFMIVKGYLHLLFASKRRKTQQDQAILALTKMRRSINHKTQSENECS